MPRAIYLTHPEVVIDPNVPVPDWGLSAVGRARLVQSAEKFADVTRIITSTERKARDGGDALGECLGITSEALPGFGENDRSATGYLPESEFWPVVEAFFGAPDESVRGWETARHAQERIVEAVLAVLRCSQKGELVLFIGHGGVGSLLYASLAGLRIGAEESMSGGMGRLFKFEIGEIPSAWISLEDL